MFDALIPGTEKLGQSQIGSIYDETGTPDSGYSEQGPYHCEDCVHLTASDEPFCIHPKVIADDRLQDRLVMIDNRPAIKICLDRGCCRYVRPPEKAENESKDENHGEDNSGN